MENKPSHIALVVLGSILVLLVFFIGALAMLDRFTDQPAQPVPVVSEQGLTPAAELALQEQIAPLIAAGDMSACDQVTDGMYKKVCINNIALKKAEETEDVSQCQYIDNELIPRADCERQVVTMLSLEKEDPSICDIATDNEVKQQCKENYPLTLAIKKNDSTACQQATDPTQCADIFYLQSFMQNPGKVSCDVFSVVEAQTDCTKVKTLANETDSQKLMGFCTSVQSELFTRFCRVLGVNQGVVPEQEPLPL